jgi:hypothetical protein
VRLASKRALFLPHRSDGRAVRRRGTSCPIGKSRWRRYIVRKDGALKYRGSNEAITTIAPA